MFVDKKWYGAYLTKGGRTRSAELIIRCSCEIEDFVKNNNCRLCVILRSRVLRGVHVVMKDIDRRLLLVPASTRVNRTLRRHSVLNDVINLQNPF